MYKLILENINGVAIWPIIALVIFFAIFTAVIVWAVFMKQKKVDHLSNLPLESDPPQRDGDQ